MPLNGNGAAEDDEPEARVVVTGEPVEANEALFTGSLDHAREFVRALDPGRRAGVAIVTDGRVYDPGEL